MSSEAQSQPQIFGKLIELLESILEKRGTDEGVVMAKRIIDYPDKIMDFVRFYKSALRSEDFEAEEDPMRKDITKILGLIDEIKLVFADAPSAPTNTPVDSDESS